MASVLAYTILGAIVVSGAYFLKRELAGDAAEDLSDRIAHGDVIRFPTERSSFHREGSSA